MEVLRAVEPGDLEALIQLASTTSHGLTTLPKEPKIMETRIQDALEGFKRIVDKPRGETYLFVLENLETGAIWGTSGIISKVGGFDPFYAFRLEKTIHESRELKVRNEIEVLHLVREHDGPCEIGSLFLSPLARTKGTGKLLSLGRFLFMAEHKDHFDPVVIAEMRGVIHSEGHSPFWDALGKHFFQVDFPRADSLSLVNKRFIAELMPSHPVYVFLLPKTAREVIGEVHPETKPALKILQSEGFGNTGLVDIFEAGPVVSCALNEIRTIARSKKFLIYKIISGDLESDPFLISAGGRKFRCCIGYLAIVPGRGVVINRNVAEALRVKAGDQVCTSPFPIEAKSKKPDQK